MKKVSLCKNIRELDRYCIEELGIPSIVLMENAALSFTEEIPTNKYKSYVILCGKGNNGGDGLAIGRKLIARGDKVVFFITNVGRETEDFKINFNIISNLKCNINYIDTIEDIDRLKEYLKEDTLIIDGIFGTGLNRNISGVCKELIEYVNASICDVYSIDIPSGLQGDSGEVLGTAIIARKTITFAMYKMGFLSYNAFEYLGQVKMKNIGMSKGTLNKFDSKCYLVDEKYIDANFKERNLLGHKGDFGKVLIFAGSVGYTGAAKICSRSAVKSGAGLTTIVCQEDVVSVISANLIEAMCIGSDSDRVQGLINGATVIAFGPGMGNSDDTYFALKDIIKKYQGPMIIDADGINVLTRNLSILNSRVDFKTIITPHLGEMSRLTGYDIEYIEKNRITVAKEFAKTNKIIVILKGYNTIITNGEQVFVNTTGNSSMASGGMGDTLTGIISSLVGQGYNELLASVLATYIHGYIGEELSKDNYVVTAEDIIINLPRYIKELTKKHINL